jgi:ferredoxin
MIPYHSPVDSPYEVLGVDPEADEDAVVEAYRERVKEAHPDHGGTQAEFQAVRTAYERIKAGDAEGGGTSGIERGPSDDEQSDERRHQESTHVEYLNYTVLDDHGWELGDDDLFERAAGADLDSVDYGDFWVRPDESLLEAAERCGYAWPFACRGGACTNCAVMVVEGDIPTPPWQILPKELIDRGIRLSCNAAPVTDEAKIIYNVKHLPGVDELRLPASRFQKARSDD